MDTLQQISEEWIPKIKSWVLSLTIEQWSIIGGSLVALILLRILIKSFRKKKPQKSIPLLELDALQIAPLGRDAFLKIRNRGESAVLSDLAIQGRNDISVKNSFAGHQIDKDKVYSILLEANGGEKFSANFSIELTYLDLEGTVRKQLLRPMLAVNN
ncbi:MAG: hypothetical protein DHS20C18_20070 [Saprospiraceae bacterium]|nr:MAG: hypothetical protein DHS20C18_20070 [Saprospiraceae bacterium]